MGCCVSRKKQAVIQPKPKLWSPEDDIRKMIKSSDEIIPPIYIDPTPYIDIPPVNQNP